MRDTVQGRSGNATKPLALPQDLSGDLLLRQAMPADIDELAAFNVRIHSDNPEEPEQWLGHWTHDLLGGNHPTTGLADTTVVVDRSANDRIVSSCVLISQRWAYDSIPFGVGRPELIGTDPGYRRRGLVRRQMDILHAWSAARGELVQAITGIPWYYRRFGYEMALDLGGSRHYRRGELDQLPALAEDDSWRVRGATAADILVLAELYDRHCALDLVRRLRDTSQWRYELELGHPDSTQHKEFRIVDHADGTPAGYFEFVEWPSGVGIREVAAEPGQSLRTVIEVAARYLRPLTQRENQPAKPLIFLLGAAHPAYQAMGNSLVPGREPYAWYIRVPDVHSFVEHIRPVLEKRLRVSPLSGWTGTARLNFFLSNMTMEFDSGRLMKLGRYSPERLEEGDATFPDLTFLQLLFGFRSLTALKQAYPDCLVRRDEVEVLLNILFPQQHSQVCPLN